MKFCKVCLYPDIKPGLEFDNEGMCSACKNNELKSRTLISNSAFNRVVIQDYSNNPFQNSKESQKYFIKFIDHIKLNNGTPYIFTTWMYKGITSNNYDVLDPMYHALKPLADKTGGLRILKEYYG